MAFFNFSRWLRSGSRVKPYRKNPKFVPWFETLEDRTVMSTLPTAVVTNPTTISASGFSPDIVQDPINPLKLVEVDSNGGSLVAQFSVNGGETWTTFGSFANRTDPTTNIAFTTVTDPTVTMDRAENVYITDIERNTTITQAGDLVFQRYLFTSTSAPTEVVADSNKIVQTWVNADPIENPVVAVDNNLTSFTDMSVTPNTTQTDTMATMFHPAGDPNPGGVDKALYIAWNTNNRVPVSDPNPATFNPSEIMVEGSQNGGATFTAAQFANKGNNVGVADGDADPQIVFTQGSADGRVAGGQLVFVWNNFGASSITLDASQPDTGGTTNIAAASESFSGTTGGFTDGAAGVAAAAVSGGGTAYTVGEILTVVGGVYPPGGTSATDAATLMVTAISGTAPGPVTSVSVVDPGVYVIRPANAAATTGGSGDATFNLGWGPPPPDTAETTTFSDTVTAATFPANFTVNDIEVTLNLTAPNDDELAITLESPGGLMIPLVLNQINTSGVAISPAQGISGSNLGEITTTANGTTVTYGIATTYGIGAGSTSGVNADVGTVFDDNAPRAINDTSFTGPYIGHFIPEGGALDQSGTTGVSPSTDAGAWKLLVTDVLNDGTTENATNTTPPVDQSVDGWTLRFSDTGANGDGTTGFGTDRAVPTAGAKLVPGAADEPYTTGISSDGGSAGFGPGISVAVDNSLGALSPFEGRIYIAYTAVPTLTNTIPTNTNIFLVSGDGLTPTAAPTWNSPVQVNDDSTSDNFSVGDRPQFMPTVAVDDSTGTVGVMYYDGRWDPALDRVGNSFSDSIDGGETFSASTFLNTPSTATNEITGDEVTIEPIPGNESLVGTLGGITPGFGDRQGLVMNDGDVIPVFASNNNIAGSAIMSDTITIADGPRIISGDEGPITNTFTFTPNDDDDQGTDQPTVIYNTTFAADGTRELSGFMIEFDRPVLISTFNPADVTLEYRDTVTPTSLPPNLTISGATDPGAFTIAPEDKGGDPTNGWGPELLGDTALSDLLATAFLITLTTPLSGVGTYSYAIGNLTTGPAITDGIKTTVHKTTGNLMDQNQSSFTGEQPDSVLKSATIDSGGAGYKVNQLLIVPGGTPFALGSVATPDSPSSVAILQVTAVGAGGVITGVKVYDAGAYTSSPSSPLGINNIGDTDTITAEFEMNFVNTSGDVFSEPTPNDVGAVTPNNGAPFTLTFGYNQSTLPLIIPGPHVVNQDNDVSTTTNANASTTATDNLILNGTTNSVDVTFDRNTQASSFTPANVVRIDGPAGPITPYTLGPAVTFTGGGGSGALAFATIVGGIITDVTVSNGGTGYTSAPTVVFNNGGGLNATGTATVAGGKVTGVTLTDGGIGYTGLTTPQAIPDGGTLNVPMTINDSLQVNDLTVGLNITDANLANLTVFLIAPNGVSVQLFDQTAGANLTNTIFDDNAASGIATGTAPFTGSFSPVLHALTATVSDAGTGYAVNDILTVLGGTFSTATQLQVTSVGAGGTITGVTVLTAGAYTNAPLTPISVTDVTTPTASGATFTLTYKGLSALAGSDYLGTWTLRITDNSSGHGTAGTLNGWALNPLSVTQENFQVVAGTGIVDQGDAGYDVNDLIAVLGGTFTTQAVLQVTSVDAITGVITGVSIENPGVYSIPPTNPAVVMDEVTGDETATLNLAFTAPYHVTFPTQTVSGTYTLTFGADTDANYIKDTQLNSVSVPVAGTGAGYVVGDMLTAVGGTVAPGGSKATFTVTAVTGGAITGIETQLPGSYTVPPPSPNAATGGSGHNAELTLVIGNEVDTNLNAGVDLLFGRNSDTLNLVAGQNGTLLPKTYSSGTINMAIPAGQTIDSIINVPDSYLVEGVTLNLTILHQNDPDLTAELIDPAEDEVLLFSNVGTSGNSPHADFTNVTLSDSALTPITEATTSGGMPGPGITGTFDPQEPLDALVSDGDGALGMWKLVISSISSTLNGTLVDWNLTLDSSVPGSGLGQQVADQFTASTRIFVQNPVNPTSQTQWTAVGPLPINNGDSAGQVTAVQVDPADPSGNTVYAAGVGGGVWKTTNFLTTDPNGPLWQPLTDTGPSNSIDVDDIAIFDRNNDPNQSIIFAATGSAGATIPVTVPGNNTRTGVGFLRSTDGGKTWALFDSTVNVDTNGNVLAIASAARDHMFVGAIVYQIIVDPTAEPDGQEIVYMAVSGGKAAADGIWRSLDGGGHWTLLQAGQGTSVALAAGSAGNNGNLQILYAAVSSGGAGIGVYFTDNAPTAASLAIQTGDNGNNIRRNIDTNPDTAIPVQNDALYPGVNGGSTIVLAVPAFVPGNTLENTLYEGWVYAAVQGESGGGSGLYVSKDFGLNWTEINLPEITIGIPGTNPTENETVGTNDNKDGNYNVGSAGGELTLTIDPNNASVIYIGGGSLNLIRVDTTALEDVYAEVAYHNSFNDTGLAQFSTEGGVDLTNVGKAYGLNPDPFVRPVTGTPISPYFNMLRDPDNPFEIPASLQFTNISSVVSGAGQPLGFTNNGYGAIWGPYDNASGLPVDSIVAIPDPLTGATRLVIGDREGVWTTTDDGTGHVASSIGTATSVDGVRNGNLQILELTAGAAQPSTLAATAADALLYGMTSVSFRIGSTNNFAGYYGAPQSAADVLDTGDVSWTNPTGYTAGTGVATDQTGSGALYQYFWPCCGAEPLESDFFQYTAAGTGTVSRTTSLLLSGDNPNANVGEWPRFSGSTFAVNPIDPTGIVMSSQPNGGATPNIWLTQGATLGTGVQWFEIGDSAQLDGSYAEAMAFGAPASATAPLDDFIYAGTHDGNIFVTTTGGGLGSPTSWIETTGLDGTPVEQIVTDPVRGSTDAYAVTEKGVYFLANGTTKWVSITGNLFGSTAALTHTLLNDPDQTESTLQALSLTSIQADYRYALPGTVSATTPVLYVAGNGGVYRSLNQGTTWTYFPDVSTDGALDNGGLLPDTDITSLTLSLGDLDPLNGEPSAPYGRDMLVATSFGNSAYVIRLNDQIIVPGGNALYTYAVNPVAGPHVVSNQLITGGAATVVKPGSGYALGDTLAVEGGTLDLGGSAAELEVTSLGAALGALVPADISGGTGYQVGDVLTVVGGAGSAAATITVTSAPGGVITGATVSTTGNYSIVPTDPVAVTGGHGTGATFDLNFTAIASVTVSVDGNYEIPPANPASVTDITGTGAGATFTEALGVTGMIVTFSGPVDPVTVDLGDINYVKDPFGNDIAVADIDDITGGNPHNIYEIDFAAPQPAYGFYTLSLGPNISDYSGDKMDQNQNFINGEDPADIYVDRLLYQPYGNSAPVLTATGPVAIGDEFEDATQAGITPTAVNSIVLSLGWPAPTAQLTDADNLIYQANTPATLAPVGIAVTSVDDTNGLWEYTLDDGQTWTAFAAAGAVESFPQAALLLEGNSNLIASPDLIEFLPNPDYNGPSTFTFQAWDLTSGLTVYGQAGGTADLTQANSTGNATAFSTGSATVTTTVLFVNDQPIITASDPPESLENSGANTVTNWAAFNPGGAPPHGDANETNQTALQYIVSGAPDPALFSAGPTVTASGHYTANLAYTLVPDAFGTYTFGVQVQDSGGTQVLAAAVATGGSGYLLGDTLTLTTGGSTLSAGDSAAQFQVTSVGAVLGVIPVGNISGGSGYNKFDILTVVGGTFTTAATIEVTSVGAGGAIATATVLTEGSYTDLPTSPVSVTDATTPSASGATFKNLSFTAVTGVEIVNDGGYNLYPPNIAPTGAVTGGHGTLATFNLTFATQALTAAAAAGGTGYVLGDDLQVQGGTPVGPTAQVQVTAVGALTGALAAANIVTAGSGYATGNVLTVVGGSFTSATTITVNTVSGTGAITSASVTNAGSYTSTPLPTNPVSVTGGAGTGATFNLTFGAVTGVTLINGGTYSTQPASAPTAVGVTDLTTAGAAGATVELNFGYVDLSFVQTYTIRVLYVNEQPSFTASNQGANENSGAHSVAPWTTFVAGGSNANDVLQSALSYTVNVTSGAALFTATGPPKVSAAGTLTYTLLPNLVGQATLAVTVEDNGGMQVVSATAASPVDGSGYSVGDLLTLQGGTFITAAQIQVTSVNGAGAITGFVIAQQDGDYTAAPTNPVSVVGGTGTGATFTLGALAGVDTSAPETYNLNVNLINDQPSFTTANLPPVPENAAGTQTVSPWATFNPGGVTEESGQSVLQYIVGTPSNTALFSSISTYPAVSNAGVLTYTIAPGISGTSTFTVAVQDNGGMQVTGAAVIATSAGSGYAVGDILDINGGTTVPGVGSMATLIVTSIGAGGSITGTTLYTDGAYTDSGLPPLTDTATDVTPGSTGTGAKFTLTENGSDTSATQTFTISVLFVNQQSSFTATNLSTDENTGANTVTNWATFNPGTGDPVSQKALTYTVSGVTNTGLFSTGLAVSASGTLTFTLNPNITGTTKFTVAVQDNGGMQAVAAALAAGGTGYKVGDLLTVKGGTFITAAQLQVTSVSAGGVVTGAIVTQTDGAYQVEPGNPVSVTDTTTSAASGATFNLTWAGNDTSATQTFTLYVNLVNQLPSFTASNPPTVIENSGAQTVNSWASNFNAGAVNESSQTVLQYIVSAVSNTGLFASGPPAGGPAVDTSGNLTYTLKSDVSGTSKFSVQVEDNGGMQATAVSSIVTGGTGYNVGDFLTVQGGTDTTPAQLQVTSVSAGVITGVLITNQDGDYTTAPTNPVSVVDTTTGTASGATFNLTIGGADLGAVQTYTISVLFVNQQPSFTASNPPTAAVSSGLNTVPGWATFNAGGVNDATQAVLKYTVSNVTNLTTLFTATGGPAVDTSGNLTYTLASGQGGTSMFTVVVQDNGGKQALAASITAVGSGYKVGDLLTVLGGTAITPAQLQVTSIGAGGAITGVTITQQDGDYQALPTNPVSVTDVTTGAAAGATFTLTFGGVDTSVSQTFTITVSVPVFAFSPTSLPNATAYAAYSQTIKATGGTAPYTYTISSGALPAGLTLATNGTLSGTPTVAGNFSFNVQAVDANNITGVEGYTLTVNGPAIKISPTTLTGLTAGVAFTQNLTASGGDGTYSNFVVSSGALPTGLTLSTAGTIGGTPTAAGAFNFTVTVQDATAGPNAPYTGSQAFSVTVAAPSIAIAPSTLPAGQAGVAYTQSVSASGGTAPYTFTISAGALPTGLAMSTAGAITGTPTAVGSFSFTVKATDSTAGTGAPFSTTKVYSVAIAAPTIGFTPTTLFNTIGGVFYSEALTGVGGTAPYSNFSITAGALPAGLTLSSSGTISGTTSTNGTFGFTVQAQDSTTGTGAPYKGSQVYSLVVSPPFSPQNLPAAMAGALYSEPITAVTGSGPASNFSVSAGALPNGLTISSAGVIGGSATAVGTFSFTLSASDTSTSSGAFTAMQQFTLSVTPPDITFTPATLANAITGVAYNQALSGAGGTAPYSNFTITAGALPTGLSLTTGGTITGTTTALGSFNFTVQAQDSTMGTGSPFTGTQPYTLTVSLPFSPASLSAAMAGVAYNQAITAATGTGPASNFSISSGALPGGVTISTNGVLSGTPTAVGTFTFTVSASDSSPASSSFTASQQYTLTVSAPVIAIAPSTLSAGTAGVAYTQVLTASGGTAPYSHFTVLTGALPAGLLLSSSGTISGTPTAVGTFTLTVQAQDSTAGPAAPYTGTTSSYTLVVSAPTITFSPSTLGPINAGAVFSQPLTGVGGTAPYSNFVVSSGALPAGLTLSTTGTLAGTATAVGTFNFKVTAQDSTTGPNKPYTGTQSYALVVNAPVIAIAPNSLNATTVGASYSQQLTPSGGNAPYSNFKLTTGSLPGGLTLTTAGLLSGTPTAAGSFSFTVQVQDSTTGANAPYLGTQMYTLTVNVPTIVLTTLPAATVGVAYNQKIVASGGTAPYTLKLTTGTLPAGLTFNTSTGVVSGTPTAGGTFPFTVTATDSSTGSGPYQGSMAYTFTVAAPTLVFNPSTLPGASVGSSFTQAITITGGTAPYINFSLASGALPTGLTLSTTGTISGTPSTAGTFNFKVQATDSSTGTGPYTQGQNYSLVVAPPTLSLTPPTLPAGLVAVAYSVQLSVTGGTAPYKNFLVTSGTLPAGFTLSSSGLLSGMPTGGGTANFTISATDSSTGSGPYTTSTAYSISVTPPNFSYDIATKTLTITGTNFTYSQSTTANATGTHTSFNFTMDGYSETLPDTVVSQVVVNGIGSTPTAILITNDTYTAVGGTTQQIPERIALGSLNNDGTGAITRFDNNDTSDASYTFLTLNNFPVSYAYAGRNDGTVTVYGTAGEAYNGFVTDGNYSYMGGPGMFHLVQGASSVYGYSAGQPTDFAYHYAKNPGSAYVVSGTAYSYMSTMDTVKGVTEPYFNVAVGFLQNTGVSNNPGQDLAYFIDSPGNDTFVGGTTVSYMYIPAPPSPYAEFDAAYGFAMVYAQSFVGGTDTAFIYDTSHNTTVGFIVVYPGEAGRTVD